FVVSTISAKYIYVNQQKTWDNARSHCLNSYTDLAPISNDYDRKLLITQNPQALSETSWIGLTRSASDYLKWVWVGGGAVQENKTFWSSGEPNDWNGKEDKGVIYGNGLQWNDEDGDSDFPFFCYKVHIVMEKKTWEEALEYCRENHRDLASVASQTELTLMHKELGKSLVTEDVWIGLRFLDGNWLWVDSQPFEYEAWS
ncbi:hypothetical protein NQD34_006137, partial [Periophthalmus magnuspinnatus]